MISFQNVTYSYQENGEPKSLNSINLKVKDGECILLCGKSGCGKTTMTRLLNGMIPNFYDGNLQGAVLLDGKNLFDLPMYEISKQVGSVFQNPRTQFYTVNTTSEIAFGCENFGMEPEKIATRVKQTAEDLEIEYLLDRNIFNLSGGEKQIIAFASIYAMSPQVYVLDEPSSNLDMDAIQDLRKHLKFVKQQGKTILIAEHRLYYLMDVADRIVYMEQGQIAGIYTPEQFKAIKKDERERMGLRAVDLHEVHPQFTSPGVTEDKILKLQDVSLFYRKQAIVEHITLSAGMGEVIGVIGHNGAGKTTLSRTLCGLHNDTSGQFLWNKKPQDRKKRLHRSYMVMQDVNFELFADSVEAECSFGIRNPDKSLIEATMDGLGLLPYRNHHPNTLSGGQKQRVAVAVSMICGKELLVFDEPTSGLDFDSMEQVALLIQKLSAMGKVIFVVTHDYEFVCRTCSRVLHIDHGEQCDDLPLVPDNEENLKKLFSI